MLSNQTILHWKQNDGGFQYDVLPNNTRGGKRVVRSLSSSAASTTEHFIQRQRRKQTRLKRKIKTKERKEKKKRRERNKKSPSSTTRAEATEASLFQYFAVDTPAIDTSAVFYPYEQARCADKSGAKEKNCFSTQTPLENQQRQKHKLTSTMADSHGNVTSNTISTRKENVRVFIRRCHRRRRRRRRTTQHRKPILFQSSSSINSHETIISSADNIEELLSFIERKINSKQKKNSRSNKNIIVVNYKPVFVNPRKEKSSQNTKATLPVVNKPIHIPISTDDEFSSATHYSRQRSFTTTSSDSSPLRSMSTCSHNQQSASLDVPDVEDPLKFIEIMYQQLFTEDGRLRSGTESVALANCVKQIVTNSRRNSTSSSVFANGSTSTHMKNTNLDTNSYPRKYSSISNHHVQQSKIASSCTSPHLISNGYYGTSSEEEHEKESETLKQTNSLHQKSITDNDVVRRNSNKLNINSNTQNHLTLNLSHFKKSLINRTGTTNNDFRVSKDDTGSEDLDTFSDLDCMNFNNIPIQPSPSVEDDFTRTDSKFLSSGYQSLDRSRKSFVQQKSYSENDLVHSIDESSTHIKSIHHCSNCTHLPNITVIPPIVSPSFSFSTIVKRIQQPIGKILMKYVNFILITKNVLLLPLFIFLLRQRSILVGN